MKRLLFDLAYRRILSKNILLPFVKDLRYVFTFHDISPRYSVHNHPVYSTDFDQFKKIVDWIRSKFVLVDLNKLTDANYQEHYPRNLASVAFDDGFYSVLELVFPYFEREKIPFTVFANQTAMQENWLWCSNLLMAIKQQNTKYLRKVYDQFVAGSGVGFEAFILDPVTCLSDNRLLTDDYSIFDEPQYTHEKVYLNEEDIKFLHSNGVTIGNHTKTHKHLSTCSTKGIREEIVENKHYLENLLGSEVAHFAIPFGFHTTYNNYAVEIAANHHRFVYDTEKNHVKNPLPKLIPRICLTDDEIPKILSYINYPIVRNINS